MGFLSNIFKKLFSTSPDAGLQQQAEQARKDAEAARASAEATQAATLAAQKQQEQALLNIQNNSQALSNANAANTQGVVTNVAAGGLADQIDSEQRKRKTNAGIASTLGLNL